MHSVLNCHNVAKHAEFCVVNVTSTGNAGCFKKSFTTLKAYINLFRGHVHYLNNQNVAKHTEFYLG
jgi:hypothetical protein